MSEANMTSEQINAEIAKGIMGWELAPSGNWMQPNSAGAFLLLTGRTIYNWSPSTDLRACAEAEARLTGEQREQYGRLLRCEVCAPFNVHDDFGAVSKAGGVSYLLATATPAQRCAALVAVLKGGK